MESKKSKVEGKEVIKRDIQSTPGETLIAILKDLPSELKLKDFT